MAKPHLPLSAENRSSRAPAKFRRKGPAIRLPLPAETRPVAVEPRRMERLADLLKPGRAMAELDAVRDRLKESATRHQQLIFQEMSVLRELHVILMSDRDVWLEFCRRPEWATNSSRMRPRPKEPEEAALFVAELLSEGDRRKRSRWKGALQELNAQGVASSEVVRALRQQGGIRGLAGKWADRMERNRDEAGVTVPSKSRNTKPIEPSSEPAQGQKGISEREGNSDKLRSSLRLKSVLIRANALGKHILSGKAKPEELYRVEILEAIDGQPVIRFRKRE